MAQMVRDNESLFTNLKATSFEGSLGYLLFARMNLPIICMLIGAC